MNAHRTLLQADLVPLAGTRLQPTGFPTSERRSSKPETAEKPSLWSRRNRWRTGWRRPPGMRLAPVSLVHGVFFARKSWPWQPKIARAVTSFIEAYDVRPAVSGGVKRDVVINEAEPGATAKGYGTVPHHRVEYTAKTITAYFTIDHAQFRSYGLSEPATALLEALADFEIANLFDGGLRLRTACDLVVAEIRGERPDAEDAARRVAKFAAECSSELGPVTEVIWSGRSK